MRPLTVLKTKYNYFKFNVAMRTPFTNSKNTLVDYTKLSYPSEDPTVKLLLASNMSDHTGGAIPY